MVKTIPESKLTFLLRTAEAIVPEAASLDAEERRAFRAIVEDALAARPAGVRRQLSLFLTVLRLAPVARWGAPLDRLAPARREAALRWFENAPLTLLRKGFWGVKALSFMGYYARPGVGAGIGYTPSFDGNARLHA